MNDPDRALILPLMLLLMQDTGELPLIFALASIIMGGK